MKILVLNGPNLDLLGTREPERYGRTTLAELVDQLDAEAHRLGAELRHVQSNSESELMQAVRDAVRDGFDGAVVNAAGLTHTSVVLRDTFLATGLTFVEVHISNIHARETFRKESYLSDIALGVITGFGPIGYELAIEAAVECLSRG